MHNKKNFVALHDGSVMSEDDYNAIFSSAAATNPDIEQMELSLFMNTMHANEQVHELKHNNVLNDEILADNNQDADSYEYDDYNQYHVIGTGNYHPDNVAMTPEHQLIYIDSNFYYNEESQSYDVPCEEPDIDYSQRFAVLHAGNKIETAADQAFNHSRDRAYKS